MAWDNGPFENDEAADFIADLAEAPDWRAVVLILDHVTKAAGYLEAPEAEMAVAAAAVVAAALSEAALLPADHQGLKAELGAPPEGAARLAKAALARVVGPASELDELWQEGDGHDGWLTHIAGLQAILSASQ
ncbi:hypothetical protein DMC25_19720 [Caulobacter sp. D4A]|uniref:DUF4259 domain-containing protein n=1 Tax=unclassified Caulobacter TaxID=2648921 RepID=UPI000D72E054|nr:MULTISPECIES: DUF4259 domain-containing protein [unclassified Caulobacter]PXA82631.1 hypothetical protein DMC25_19720 [Caulobacter sp. D4A]PXA93309.1 hypothetical protein DMC18_09200 [Caulobacter sp. D5]